MSIVHTSVCGPFYNPIRHFQFMDDLHDVSVAGEPVMVEFFEPFFACRKAAGKAADLSIPLQYRGTDTTFAQLIGGGKAAKTGTDHHNAGGSF